MLRERLGCSWAFDVARVHYGACSDGGQDGSGPFATGYAVGAVMAGSHGGEAGAISNAFERLGTAAGQTRDRPILMRVWMSRTFMGRASWLADKTEMSHSW